MGASLLLLLGVHNHLHLLCTSLPRLERILKVLSDGSAQPYCIDCGTTSCAACKQPIVSGGAYALDRNWHLECFVCVSCKSSFDKDDGQFVVTDRQEPMCIGCSEKVSAKAAKQKKGEKKGKGRRTKHTQKCDTCKGELTANSTMLVALGKAYHRHCFKCYKCKKLLEGAKFVTVGNKAACHGCAADTLAEKCTSCKKPITGTIVVALSRNWHPECLNCMRCKQPIVNYGKVYRRGKQPCCPKCVETVFNSRQQKRQSKRTKRGAELCASLEALLSEEIGIDYFLRYLVTEYSVENLLFYLDVLQFEVLETEHDRVIYSKSIVNKYLSTDAELELNLNGNTRILVCSRVDAPYPAMFKEALAEVMSLMADCSFQRFLNSPEARELRAL